MALPAILGSLLLEIKAVMSTVATISLAPVLTGFFTSLVVGYLSIKLFNLVVKKGSMIYFSIYLWAVSLLLVVTL